MRRKPKGQPDAPLAPVPAEILDQFVGPGPIPHEELDAAVRRFKKAMIERALGGELTHHLGYPPGGKPAGGRHQSSQRVGQQDGADRRWLLPIDVPRYRAGTFAPDRQTRAPVHRRR